MPPKKIVVTLDETVLKKVDRMVARSDLPNRSLFVEEALKEKLAHVRQNCLARECAKLDPCMEKAMAEGLHKGDLRIS